MRAARKQRETVALAIGDHGDELGGERAREGRARQPAVGLLLLDRQLAVVVPARRADPGLGIEQPEAAVVLGIEGQERMHEQAGITAVADRPEPAHPPGMMLEVDLGGVLQDEDMRAPGTERGGGGGEAGAQLRGPEMAAGEKAREGDLFGPRGGEHPRLGAGVRSCAPAFHCRGGRGADRAVR